MSDKFKYKFHYKGPVLQFNTILATDYEMETIAESPEKAASQMIYRFKINHGLLQSTRITIKKDLIKCDDTQVYMY